MLSIGIKGDLKSSVQEHLGESASSFFLDKVFAIIDESANNKASFLAAADTISKRVALFIDTDVSKKLSAALIARIEESSSPPGTKRKHARVSMSAKVSVTCEGRSYEFYSETLSGGGIYLKTKEPFPEGAAVKIALPLGDGNPLHLNGVVVYANRSQQDSSQYSPGMAVEFRDMKDEDSRKIQSYIEKIQA